MRPQVAHRRNSAFTRSSGLGEARLDPVIKEVSVRRGAGAKKVIVKDGLISRQKFGFSKRDILTFEAELVGSGYFYATSSRNGEEHLLFVVPVQRKIEHTITLQMPIEGLNFHISQNIPTNLNPAYIDDFSRMLLKNVPSSYTSLGFIPTEPETSPFTGSFDEAKKQAEKIKLLNRYNQTFKDQVDAQLARYEARGSNWDQWPGRVNQHSWNYGRSGTEATTGESVKWYPNYDGGWLGAASTYKYIPTKGWETVQQANQYLQVGQPHCIVGQLVGYKDTISKGGEYHYYTGNGTNSTNTTWKYADEMSGNRIRLMHQTYVNQYGVEEHGSRAGKTNFEIQEYHQAGNGGEVTQSFKGSYWFPTPDHPDGVNSDKYCAMVEWWNPDSRIWSKPAVHPPWSTKLSTTGKFAFYFRFPRQLAKDDEFYDQTPQWQIDGLEPTKLCYPFASSTVGSVGEVRYARIGRPPVKGTENEGLEVEDESGNKIRTRKTSPIYHIMIAPESKSDDGVRDAHDNQKKSYICINSCNISAVDPVAYSYSANPDILKAYWKGGNFKPGGSFMLMGKAADFFQGFWVSSGSLASKGNTPMDLGQQQFDFVRGESEPNTYTADKISNFTRFKATDVDDPRKVGNFQQSWDACFPGVPFNKQILTAMIRGDQLPELEGITYEKLPGFIDDDPLRYEVEYEGEKYRHPYSLVYCKIPEGWWGPTVDKDSGPDSVYIGGQNWYYYIFEEKVDLRAELEYQLALDDAGLTAAEQFAASELENPMVDITFEAYKNRNATVKESINAPTQKEKNWFLRTEQVKWKHKTVAFGSVGTVTDVTDRYSADQITSLDGLSSKNTRQYGFNDMFLVEGMGNTPSIVLTPPKEPQGSGVPLKVSNVSGFGNSERQALKARALGNGNPMKYSTEEKQDSMQIAPMGSVLDSAIGLDDGTIKDTVTTGAYVVGGLVALGALVKLVPMWNSIQMSKALKNTARNRLKESQLDLITSVKKAKRA